MIFRRLLPVVLAFSVSAALAEPTVLERLEASVNSDTILLSDLAKFRRTVALRSQLDPLFAGTSLAEKGSQATQEEITQFLIDEHLILQAFPMTDTDVENEIKTIQSSNNISKDQLRSALRAQGFQYEDYFELIRIGAAKRNLIDREIRTKVSISEDDIRNYFYNHYSKGKTLPKTYYLKMISTSSRGEAEEALKALRNGEKFEDVARRVSQDPSSSQGGELPPISDDQLSVTIRDQMKGLRIGEITGIFSSGSQSFSIVKLADIRSADDSQIKRLENEIRGILATSEYQRQLTLWLDRQRQAAFVHRSGVSITQQLLKK